MGDGDFIESLQYEAATEYARYRITQLAASLWPLWAGSAALILYLVLRK